MREPSVRAQIITRRTYQRPLDDTSTARETWYETIQRVINHQAFLWTRAGFGYLSDANYRELDELEQLYYDRSALPAGRTLWLGGTDVVKRREASSFNCSFCKVATIHDMVDVFWLLLQGCGVGHYPVTGSLSGFYRKMEVSVIRSARTDKGGNEHNSECYDPETHVWKIQVGDSAEAWAKSIGKIVAGKYPAKKLILDFSQIRPAGSVLKGYGWVCCGDQNLSIAFAAIAEIMNARAGKLLSKMDIWDIVNWLGTVLSNRRSAQMGHIHYGDPEWESAATRKPIGFDKGNLWFRSQSNNSIIYEDKPTLRQIRRHFEIMESCGGSEPGFINGAQCRERAPWWSGFNPCAEISPRRRDVLLPRRDERRPVQGRLPGLLPAVWLNGRANYRRTCVNLKDGILQDKWRQTNEFLHLCGVSLTGLVPRRT